MSTGADVLIPCLSNLRLRSLPTSAFAYVHTEKTDVPSLGKQYDPVAMAGFVEYIVNRVKREGTQLYNAPGIAFNEGMVLGTVLRAKPTFPIVVTGTSDQAFRESWEDSIVRSGMGVFADYLRDSQNTVKDALRMGIVPERIKLMLEVLEGTITAPHADESIELLLQKMRCSTGMRLPAYIESEAEPWRGYEGNIDDGTASIHQLISQIHPSMGLFNAHAVRALYASHAPKCCLGDSGKSGDFVVGLPEMRIGEDFLGSIDTLRPDSDEEYITLITFLGKPTSIPNVGGVIHNTDRVYTSTNPNWTHLNDFSCYVLKMQGAFRCTVQEKFAAYSDLFLISHEKDGDVVRVQTATLPVVVLPSNMIFTVTDVKYTDAHPFSKRESGEPMPVIFATWDRTYQPHKRKFTLKDIHDPIVLS